MAGAGAGAGEGWEEGVPWVLPLPFGLIGSLNMEIQTSTCREMSQRL
jgi:hypothetical protein